jgi:hypothetical protein
MTCQSSSISRLSSDQSENVERNQVPSLPKVRESSVPMIWSNARVSGALFHGARVNPTSLHITSIMGGGAVVLTSFGGPLGYGAEWMGCAIEEMSNAR